jgi:hypothetical protein
MDRNREKINDMMRSRTPQELIAAQSDLFRDNLEGFLQSSKRVAEESISRQEWIRLCSRCSSVLASFAVDRA